MLRFLGKTNWPADEPPIAVADFEDSSCGWRELKTKPLGESAGGMASTFWILRNEPNLGGAGRLVTDVAGFGKDELAADEPPWAGAGPPEEMKTNRVDFAVWCSSS